MVMYSVINGGARTGGPFETKEEARKWMSDNGGTSIIVEYIK